MVFTSATENNLAQAQIDFRIDIANKLQTYFDRQEKITNKFLFESAEKSKYLYWQWHDIYEALEIAQTLDTISYLRRNKSKTNEEKLEYLLQRDNLIPVKQVRSLNQINKQQFSTPFPYAFCATILAQINEKDIILEPSAGNGALAVFGALITDLVYFNEIDPARHQQLEYIFPDEELFQFNAEQIDDFLPANVRPSLVLMNPPFSSSLYSKKKESTTVAKHTFSALKRLKEGGRLVLISNEGFHPSNKTYSTYFRKIEAIANLEFSVELDGKIYAKNGTSVNTRLSLFTKSKNKNKTIFVDKIDDIVTLYQIVKEFLQDNFSQGTTEDNSLSNNLLSSNIISFPKDRQKTALLLIIKVLYLKSVTMVAFCFLKR